MNFHDNESLDVWGWDSAWLDAFHESLTQCPRGLKPVPARVVGREGPVHLLETAVGPREGLISGRLQYSAPEAGLPVVGDWVAVQAGDPAVIHAVLGRRSTFSRAVGAAKGGPGREGLLAANIDVLAVVMGLDSNFNPRRAQRLSTLARHGGMKPLWILSKADLPGAGAKHEAALRAAGGDPVVALSPLTGEGLEALSPWLSPGTTVALTGSSGVGKTTLVNRLAGAALATLPVRDADSKGRHTTTSRHLYRLPGGSLLMDTPGLRTVGLWADADDLAEGFTDIEALAASCRFADCRHDGEPGCAVRAALDDGTLDEARWEGWRRQERELRYLDRRGDTTAQRAEKDRWKAINKSMRGFTKESRRGG